MGCLGWTKIVVIGRGLNSTKGRFHLQAALRDHMCKIAMWRYDEVNDGKIGVKLSRVLPDFDSTARANQAEITAYCDRNGSH